MATAAAAGPVVVEKRGVVGTCECKDLVRIMDLSGAQFLKAAKKIGSRANSANNESTVCGP